MFEADALEQDARHHLAPDPNHPLPAVGKRKDRRAAVRSPPETPRRMMAESALVSAGAARGWTAR
jgi:hypothetical protein